MVKLAFDSLRAIDKENLRKQGVREQHRRKLAKHGLDLDDSLVDNEFLTVQRPGQKPKPKPQPQLTDEAPLTMPVINFGGDEKESELNEHGDRVMNEVDWQTVMNSEDGEPLVAPAMSFGK